MIWLEWMLISVRYAAHMSMSRGQEHRGGTETACVICPALGGGMRPEGAEGAEGGG